MVRIVQEHFDNSTKLFYINETEDVEPLLDSLQEERNHNDPRAYKKNAARWRKVANLPMIIIDKWMKEDPPFNALAPGNEKEVLRRLQQEYPKFLAVDKI